MITLASGNTFFYLPETDEQFSTAFIIDEKLNFVGGFLCDEADRKLAAFSKLQNVKIETVTVSIVQQFLGWAKLDDFAAKLGAASSLFLNNWNRMISDRQDCDGTSSRAESCDDRQYYYESVGCYKLFKSSKRFPLWALIANHVAIFSVEKFRLTFFRGYDDNPQKEAYVETKSRYRDGSFQAPAAYIRAFCIH
jgi:hypothetical protein